jgi:hypothetical protein
LGDIYSVVKVESDFEDDKDNEVIYLVIVPLPELCIIFNLPSLTEAFGRN